MNSKSVFRVMFDKFLEESLEDSSFAKKIISSTTLVALEMKKIAELALALNERINQHELILLKVLEFQKEKKDSGLDFSIKSKSGSSKPN